MTRKRRLFVLVLLIASLNLFAQDDFSKQLNNRFNQYLLGHIQEKVYVQTTSDAYQPGDNIWFKASLTNAINHHMATKEKLLYIDLISPQNKVVVHSLALLNDGFADGTISLGKGLLTGQYKLVAYTDYMRNYSSDFFFQKEIMLVNRLNDSRQWAFEPKVIPGHGGDSIFVELQASDRNEFNGTVDISLQLARGTIFGASCTILNNAGSFSLFVPDSLKTPTALLSLKSTGADGEGAKYSIPLSASKPDLQFMPEGGELVPGQENLLAFRCVDSNGNPLEINGTITDSTEGINIPFATQYQGMGNVYFTPIIGTSYRATINYRDSVFTYSLPDTKEIAYTLQSTAQYNDTIRFALLTSSADEKPYLLFGHCRGIGKYTAHGVLSTQRTELAVPASNFPEGVITFTLFIDDKPRAERLVFLDKGEDITLELLKQDAHHEDSTTTFEVKASQKDGTPVSGNFSLLACRNSQTENQLDVETIRDYLLFTSDLQGQTVDDLGSGIEKAFKTDLLLQTFGWRRFNWEVIEKYQPEKNAYSSGNSMYLYGKIYRTMNGKSVPKGIDLSIVLRQEGKMHVDNTKTSDHGDFYFDLPVFTDSAQLLVQTKSRLKYQKDYLIDINTNLESFRLTPYGFNQIAKTTLKPVVDNWSSSHRIEKETQAVVTTNTLVTHKKSRVDNYYFPGKDTILIKDVDVFSKYRNDKDSIIAMVGQPDATIANGQLKQLTEEKPWYADIWDLLKDQIPGLLIFERNLGSYNLAIPRDPAPSLYLKVNSNPRGYLYIIVDNDLISNPNFPLFDLLDGLDVSEIKSINFIAKPKEYDSSLRTNGMETDILANIVKENVGGDGSNRIIGSITETMSVLAQNNDERFINPPAFLFITTKSGKGIFDQRARGLQSLYLQGISASREFYAPKYENMKTPEQQTIYWQPQLVTDSTGVAHVTLPFNVDNENIKWFVQGISANGETGAKWFDFNKEGVSSHETTIGIAAEHEQKTSSRDKSKGAVNEYRKYGLYSGKVIDGLTGMPVSFADLQVDDPYYHTCINDSGCFLVSENMSKRVNGITVSAPGYASKVVLLPANMDSMVIVQLDKIIPAKIDQTTDARKIVKKAITESVKRYASKAVFQGFSREVVTVDNEIYSINEMAFNYSNGETYYDQDAIRFETVKMNNMADKIGYPLKSLRPNHRMIFHPVNSDVLATLPDFWNTSNYVNFDYRIIGTVHYGGETCFKIRFQQNNNMVIPLQDGILYVGKESGVLRYTEWGTNPARSNEVSYTEFLHSNPMNDNIRLADDCHRVSYALVGDELYLMGIQNGYTIIVNNEHIMTIETRLSVTEKINRQYKSLKNQNVEILVDRGEAQSMQVKHPRYQVEPWINWGFIMPEEKLIGEAKYLHDVLVYH